ncbi:MAG: cytochrome c biogenesis protein CcdA, partial [Paramuribaculum sp.]
MKQRLFFVTLFLSFIAASVANAQSEVKWTQNLRMTSDTEGVMEFTASIADGWHIYGTDIPSDGPTATEIDFRNLTGMELVGNLTASKSPVTYMDALFNMKISSWEGHVVLSQKFKLKNGSKGCKADGVIAFMSCNDKTCSRPERIPFELSYNESGAVPAGDSVPEKKDNMVAAADTVPLHTPSADKASWWKPVDVKSDTDVHAGWWYIFIWGFVGGLLALLTPCVWPMIPLTVSFFLKKNTSRRRSVLDAVIYGGSIIVIYLTLGIAVTLIFGAGKLNELATNAVFNLIFFGILVLFAVSFFGAFDIKLPAKWSNSVDGRAERTTGLISIFFMAFTLVLVSFSCTGPLIGTLLVEAASQGNIVGPAVGMGAFALALAIPFTLFAIFPSLLKDMPRSGGWLNSVKVVLGFLELILSLKFLSVVDLAYGWRILDREVFIAIWIVLFVLLGLY